MHPLVKRALDGDRAAAIELWHDVVAGNFEDGALDWVVEVAKRIINADEELDLGLRPAKIVHAVGLQGRLRPTKQGRLHEFVEIYDEFDWPMELRRCIDNASSRTADELSKVRSTKVPVVVWLLPDKWNQRGWHLDNLIKNLQLNKLIRKDETKEEIRKKIDRARAEIKDRNMKVVDGRTA